MAQKTTVTMRILSDSVVDCHTKRVVSITSKFMASCFRRTL